MIDTKIIKGADNISQLFTRVEAMYEFHPDMKSRTGGGMLFCYGLIHCKSTKNEVVGVRNYLPYNICICIFMESQGYGIKQNILFQVNQGAMKLEKNGKKSCLRNSRNMDIRFF